LSTLFSSIQQIEVAPSGERVIRSDYYQQLTFTVKTM